MWKNDNNNHPVKLLRVESHEVCDRAVISFLRCRREKTAGQLAPVFMVNDTLAADAGLVACGICAGTSLFVLFHAALSGHFILPPVIQNVL